MSAHCRFFAARQGQDWSIFCEIWSVADGDYVPDGRSSELLRRNLIQAYAAIQSRIFHSACHNAVAVPVADALWEFVGLNLSAVRALPLRNAVLENDFRK
jgi:hypothetical protein